MSVLKRVHLNGIADGTTYTSATTGGGDSTTVSVTGTGTGVVSTAASIRGQRGLRVTGAVDDVYTVGLFNTAAGIASGQVYFRVSAARAPVAASAVMGRFRGSANAAIMVLSTARIFSIQNAAGSGLKNFNSNTALPDGAYVANLIAIPGTTTSNGYIGCWLYNAATSALVDSFESSAVNATTSTISQFQVGKPVAQGSVDLDIDEFAFQTEVNAQIPFVPANLNPTVSVSAADVLIEPAQTTVVTATAADADGTIASYAWDIVSNSAGGSLALTQAGATATITGPTTQTGGSARVRCTVADDKGATSSAYTDVTILRAARSYKINGVMTPSLRKVQQTVDSIAYDAVGARGLAAMSQPIAWAKRNNVNFMIGEVGIPADSDGSKYDTRYNINLRAWMLKAKNENVPFQIWGTSEWTSDLRAYRPAAGTDTVLSVRSNVGQILEENLWHSLNGTNLSGADFGQNGYQLTPRPGVVGTNYDYPSTESLQYLAARGIKTIRFPFRWERLQPVLNSAFDTAEQARLTAVLDTCRSLGMRVIADMHNYGAYSTSASAYLLLGDAAPAGVGVTTMNDAFVAFWTRFAQLFGTHAGLSGYGLCNEPHDITGGGDTWRTVSSAAAVAIRTIDPVGKIFVSGYYYATCVGWDDQNGQTPWLYTWVNGKPLNEDPNVWFEGHMYFDTDGRYEITYANNLAAAVASGFTSGVIGSAPPTTTSLGYGLAAYGTAPYGG